MLTAESVRPPVLLPLCHISIRMHTICHNLGRGFGHVGMNLRCTSFAEVFPDLLTLSELTKGTMKFVALLRRHRHQPNSSAHNLTRVGRIQPETFVLFIAKVC